MQCVQYFILHATQTPLYSLVYLGIRALMEMLPRVKFFNTYMGNIHVLLVDDVSVWTQMGAELEVADRHIHALFGQLMLHEEVERRRVHMLLNLADPVRFVRSALEQMMNVGLKLFFVLLLLQGFDCVGAGDGHVKLLVARGDQIHLLRVVALDKLLRRANFGAVVRVVREAALAQFGDPQLADG